METLSPDIRRIIDSFIPYRQFHAIKYKHVTKSIKERGSLVKRCHQITTKFNVSLPKNVYTFCTDSKRFIRIVAIGYINGNYKPKKSIFYTTRVVLLTKLQYNDLCCVPAKLHLKYHSRSNCNCAYNILRNDKNGILDSKNIVCRLFKKRFIQIYVT